MLTDSRSLEEGALVEGDVCIAGAGAAGIALARELSASGRRIVLLESGGRTYEQETQSLYSGSESGPLIRPNAYYLSSTRLRYLGGTTNHWNGWCRPLEDDDFEVREWVGESGWPLSRDALAPYFDRAADLVGVTPFDYSSEELERERAPFLLDPQSGFETRFFHLSPPTRFATAYGPELAAAADVSLILHANLTRIEVNESASAVTEFRVAALDGPTFRVRAGTYVLAAGAIENARLLLASRQVQAEGLGNSHDLVGRYFMDHPLLRVGFLGVPDGARALQLYQKFRLGERPHPVRGVLWPSADLLRRERLLKSLMVVERLRSREIPELGPEIAALAERVAERKGRRRSRQDKAARFAVLTMTCESAPNRQSRVRLGEEVDALGVPRAVLEWRLSEQDPVSMRRTALLLASRIASHGRGRAKLTVLGEEEWPGAGGSPHQMGTTRMHPDPRRGVVDSSSAVHGVDNLYMAGASVFPVSGRVNPTFTLLALTLRLADHLKERWT